MSGSSFPRSHVHVAVMLIDAGMGTDPAMRIASDVKSLGLARIKDVLHEAVERSRKAEKTSREHAEQLEAVLAMLDLGAP